MISLNINEISQQSDAVQTLEFLSKVCKLTEKYNLSSILEHVIKEELTHNHLMSIVGFARYPIDSLTISYRSAEDNLEILMSSHLSIAKKISKGTNVKSWDTHDKPASASDPVLTSLGLDKVDKVVVISSLLDVVKQLNRVEPVKELYFITNDPAIQKRAALFRNVTAYCLKDFPRNYDNLLEKSILNLFSAGVIDISDNLMVISGSTYNKSAKDGRAEIIEAKSFLIA